MSSGPPRLVLDDEQGYADLRTFVSRARGLDEDGAIRLQALGEVLAAYVEVLPGRGLMGGGEVVGLRTMRLGQAATFDTTVSLGALADRLARPGRPGEGVELPPFTIQASWTAMTPPRAGWEPVGFLDAGALVETARAGIAEVATGAGASAGGPAVADLRSRVWGRLTETVPPVPAGVAFGAYALGFIGAFPPGSLGAGDPGGRCDVVVHGRWTRLSSPRGHVLAR